MPGFGKMRRIKSKLSQMMNNNRHIFFVDDEPKVRHVVAETFEQCVLSVGL